MTWAILATGESMTPEVAAAVRGRCKVVAVSDAFRLAPWADVLASCDAAWWKANPDALKFEGLRVGAMPDFQAVSGVERRAAVSGVNSGLFACEVAVSLGAKTLLLCGFDMGGTHFFGDHPAPLKKTTPARFEVFKRQFEHYRPRGVEIVNCTPGSALHCYPKGDLACALG